MTNVLVLDAGNAIIKAKTASREIEFPHGLVQLSENDFSKATRGGGVPHEDYVRVNGIPYVVGKHAENHGLQRGTFQTGAARYTETYYGVFVAVSLARCYQRNVKNVFLFGSHAPGDKDYRDDLMRAGAQDWVVSMNGVEYKFSVSEANTFDEPNGGVSNILLSTDGTKLQRPEIKRGTTLVIDVGGHTTDFLIVNPGGEVDYSSARSQPNAGINAVLESLEEMMRQEHRLLFKKQNGFRASKLREALREGKYDAGGKGMLDVKKLTEQACNGLLNVIGNIYQNYGGATEYNYIVLTGGGGGALETRLKPILEHPNVILADKPNDVQFANVRGGLKLFRLYEAHGWL